MGKNSANWILVFFENDRWEQVPSNRTIFEVVNYFVDFCFRSWAQEKIYCIIFWYKVQWAHIGHWDFLIQCRTNICKKFVETLRYQKRVVDKVPIYGNLG